MKRTIVFLLSAMVCIGLFAQGEMDAFRLSGSDLRGTARGQAMGGAFGALGGDVTGIMINPAGLGLYRSSEINTSLAFTSIQQETNTINKQGKFNFNFDNISYVGYFPTGYQSANVINFAFSYNRLKNFDRRFSASGRDQETSLSDYIAAITNRGSVFYKDMEPKGNYDPYQNQTIPWLSTLAWLGYLVDSIPGSGQYSGLFPAELLSSNLNVTERGYIENYDFSLGTNFSDKFYLGGTLTFTNIQYHLDASYGETFLQRGNIGLNNFFDTWGGGYQFKIGGVWRPMHFLRLGLAYHSPIWYSLTDRYQGKTFANYSGVKNTQEVTPENAQTDYLFTSPYSWTFSIAGILGTKAIISLDYEIKDYSGMELMDRNGYPKKQDNQYIQEDFQSASTLRAGLEYRITPQLSGRLGYSSMQNPYEKKFKDGWKEVAIIGTVPHYTIEGCSNYYTMGIGYRFTSQFYIDAAFVYKTQKDQLYNYPSVWDEEGNYIVKSAPVSLTNNTYKGLLTVGYKF